MRLGFFSENAATFAAMQWVAQLIFWGSVLALAHTYVFYPWLMRWLARGKRLNDSDVFSANEPDSLPSVSVLMAVYNEERILAQKLQSLAQLRYPLEKIFLYIGSDCSDDASAAIVTQFKENLQAKNHPLAERIRFVHFTERRGKPPVINDLAKMAIAHWGAVPQHVFLMTDANVLLEADTLYGLVRHFRQPFMGCVDAHMRTTGLRQAGISQSENIYITNEVRLKHWEGLAWGTMMGPFGGCYALRSDLFEPVPPNSLVDDFYIVFRLLEKGFHAINDLTAICYEGATHRVEDEYRRKKRIAAGSFQNLARFRRWVLPPTTRLGFSFFSHKVLRWYGGFFMLFAWLAAGYLWYTDHPFHRVFFCLQTLGIVLVVVGNWVLARWNLQPVWPLSLLRNLAYFLAMNVALMDGFFKWWKGIRENYWNRTVRE